MDDFYRAVWTYLLNEKREVAQILKNFCTMVERQFKTRVQTVRNDNGTEFMCLKSDFAAEGILHQTLECLSRMEELSESIVIF